MFDLFVDGKRWGETTRPQSRSRLIQLGLRLRIRGGLGSRPVGIGVLPRRIRNEPN